MHELENIEPIEPGKLKEWPSSTITESSENICFAGWN